MRFTLPLTTIACTLFAVAEANKKITVQNNCGTVVTVGVLTNGVSAGSPEMSFDLTSGASNSFTKPNEWGGRVWGRYLCSGSAGNDAQKCGVPGATNPASLAEFFFHGIGGKDFYDISLVDGFNIPMSITPDGGDPPNGYSCGSPKCHIETCPPEFAVLDSTGNVISCQSDCSKTGDDQHCCAGDYNHPDICKPSDNAMAIKEVCPDAYSFAYDDQQSTFECAAEAFTVHFC